MDYLHQRGVKTVYLDGVQKAVSLYERAGFRKVCPSLRFFGRLAGRSHPGVRAMTLADLEMVCRLDLEAFGADRGFFLRRRLELAPDLCQVLVPGSRIAGYIMARQRSGLLAVGPWVVREGIDRPERLLESLVLAAGDADIALGVLGIHAPAVEFIRSLGLAERPFPPWRMVLGRRGRLGASRCCFAVGSAAKG